jgi:hypothetical protein
VIIFHIISTVHFDDDSQLSKNQQMHYIIKYCSISPTYVLATVEPSSGGLVVWLITTLQDTLTRDNTNLIKLTGLGQLQFV